MLVGRQRPRPGFMCAQPASKGKRCAYGCIPGRWGVQPDSPKAHQAHLVLNLETARFFLLKLETGDAMWNLSASQIKRSVPQVLSSPASQPAWRPQAAAPRISLAFYARTDAIPRFLFRACRFLEPFIPHMHATIASSLSHRKGHISVSL